MQENPPVPNGLTWRSLNKEGCEVGRATKRDLAALEQATEKELSDLTEKMKCMESKLDRLTWALVGAAITFGTAALMLALNLIF